MTTSEQKKNLTIEKNGKTCFMSLNYHIILKGER